MKKILAFISALVIMGGVACAGDFYNGDIQIQLGYAINEATVEDVDKSISSNEFDFGLETYHFFKPFEMLGIGFMGGLNVGVGKTENWKTFGDDPNVKYTDGLSVSLNADFGPAVAFYLKNIVRFAFNIGYNYGWKFDTPSSYTMDSKYISGNGYNTVQASYNGLALGLQAKFLPNCKVNPVVGWRMVKGFADSVDYVTLTPGSSGRYDDGTLDQKFDLTQNVIYAALSFSW